MAGTLQVQFIVKTKANTPVACSVEWAGEDGSGVNIGTGDQTTDHRGRTTFNVENEVLRAVASSKGPGVLKVWARHGGTAEDAPPINDTYLEEINVL